MRVYQTDPKGILVDYVDLDDTDLDPELLKTGERQYLIPGGCRTTEPPTLAANQVARATSNAIDCEWEVVPDFRGKDYWLAYGDKHTMEDVGALPDGASLTEPLPPLDLVKSRQSSLIEAKCATQIMAGFTSSALGADYTYPSAFTDQLNLNGSITASLVEGPSNSSWTTPFACADSQGVWDKRMHTATQIQKVGSDFVAFKLALLIKKDGLLAQIDAATTNDAATAITW